MIKVSDYIVKRLEEHGVEHVFMIPGGGAMHLNDSVGKSEKISYICNHHEQASAIGAEGYARSSGKLGVAVVTSGPGATNTITGVVGQWVDSVPVLYISGQIKQETSIESCREIGLRQLGDQEINIVDIVKPITKFAAIVDDPVKVKKLIDKAVYIAVHGRPGPVWLDVPLNIQGAVVDESSLLEYDEKENRAEFDEEQFELKISETVKLLKKAERPVFVAGHGIRISGANSSFLKLVEKLGIPVVTTFNGFDLIPSDHPLFVGRVGTMGSRSGNFAVQNSDLVLFIGTRNNIRQVSYNWQSFARCAKKIVVDIDQAELNKHTLIPDVAINSDAGIFIEKLNSHADREIFPDRQSWIGWNKERQKRYPVVLPEYKDLKSFINPYYFTEVLTKCLREGDTVVSANGTACVALFQASIIKRNQRMFMNSGCATMGYDLPAAIGACFATGKKDVVCLAGDGSLQMNIQELQTIMHHNLPIKLFILDNNGYISMRQTQESFFEKRYVACDKDSGVSFPDSVKIASAYGLPVKVIDSQNNLKEKIQEVLRTSGPIVCEVKLLTDYKFTPKLSSERKPDGRMVSKPLEDLYPFLEREEFRSNMIVPLWDEE